MPGRSSPRSSLSRISVSIQTDRFHRTCRLSINPRKHRARRFEDPARVDETSLNKLEPTAYFPYALGRAHELYAMGLGVLRLIDASYVGQRRPMQPPNANRAARRGAGLVGVSRTSVGWNLEAPSFFPPPPNLKLLCMNANGLFVLFVWREGVHEFMPWPPAPVSFALTCVTLTTCQPRSCVRRGRGLWRAPDPSFVLCAAPPRLQFWARK